MTQRRQGNNILGNGTKVKRLSSSAAPAAWGATAKMLIDGGARVLVTGRSQAGLERQRVGNNAIVASSDARSLTDIDVLASRVKAEFDTFDLLLNAGFSIPTPLESVNLTLPRRDVQPERQGTVFRGAEARAADQPGGSVVVTTSIANIMGMPGQATYGAAKAALRSFARVLSAELLPRDIRGERGDARSHRHGASSKASDKGAAAKMSWTRQRHESDEALRDVCGNRQGRSLPRVRCDLHDRRRTSGRWGLVATLMAMRCSINGALGPLEAKLLNLRP